MQNTFSMEKWKEKKWENKVHFRSLIPSSDWWEPLMKTPSKGPIAAIGFWYLFCMYRATHVHYCELLCVNGKLAQHPFWCVDAAGTLTSCQMSSWSNQECTGLPSWIHSFSFVNTSGDISDQSRNMAFKCWKEKTVQRQKSLF